MSAAIISPDDEKDLDRCGFRVWSEVFFGELPMPFEEEEIPRPRAVTVIGRLWLVLAVIAFCRSLINLIVWKLIQPAAPSLLQAFAQSSPQTSQLTILFAHLTAWMIVEAVLSIAVAVCAYGLLRLWPWARAAVETVCWFALAYIVSFAGLWLSFWIRRVGRPAVSSWSPNTREEVALVGVMAVCLAVAAGVVTMIVTLRGSRVRNVFARSPHPAQLARDIAATRPNG